MRYKNIIIGCILFLLFNHAFAQNVEQTRTINRTFALTKQSSIKVSNKYGNVMLNTWDKDSVGFAVSIRVSERREADAIDPNTGNNNSSATVTPQQADIALAKSVNNAMPNVGDTVSFTVTLANNGPDTATNVTVQDLLPAGLTFVSATPSQGAYNNGTGIWTLGTVTTATPQTLVIQATVASLGAKINMATINPPGPC